MQYIFLTFSPFGDPGLHVGLQTAVTDRINKHFQLLLAAYNMLIIDDSVTQTAAVTLLYLCTHCATNSST